MTYDEVLKIKQGLDKSEESSEPFLYMDEDGKKVIGDANDTQVKKFNYVMDFETEDGKRIRKEYSDVYVTPRKRFPAVRILVRMLPYFRKAMPDGTVGEYEDEEAAQVFLTMEDRIYDEMYDLAATILEVPDDLKDYMEPVSVVAFTIKFINDHPAVVREADMSFG